MRAIERGEVRLMTESFGEACNPPVMLVMGATASMLGWPDGFCRALAARGFFVIRFDHRDTGQSTTVPPGTSTYSIEDMAGDVLAVMDAHAVTRAHLVGMSLGGLICQMLAAGNAGRVASLTLIAAEPLGWDGAPMPPISQAFLDHFGRLSELDWSDPAAVADFLTGTERLCAGTGVPFDEAAAQARVAQVLARTDSPASMFNHATLGLDGDWTGRFRQISAPVLVIHGEDDPIVALANGTALAEGIADAELMVLAGVGHELPARLIDRIADRIADHVGAAAGMTA